MGKGKVRTVGRGHARGGMERGIALFDADEVTSHHHQARRYVCLFTLFVALDMKILNLRLGERRSFIVEEWKFWILVMFTFVGTKALLGVSLVVQVGIG